MLFENDGSAADTVNRFAEEFGDGAVMDAMRRKMAREWDGRQLAMVDEFNAVASRVHETERVAEDETGLIPDFSIPLILYHQYPAEFKMKALEQGIELPLNGYECWDCDEFKAWFKKKHPELVHKEAKRNACIIVPATRYTSLKGLAHVA